MKNLILVASLIIFNFYSGISQNFEGEIKFEMEYENLPEGMEMYKAMAAKEVLYKIKGKKIKMEMDQSIIKVASIVNMETNTTIILSNALGKKTAEYISSSDDQDTLKMIKISGTKTILGYECKKAVLKGDSGNILATYWYSEKFQGYSSPEFPDYSLDGFPLETIITTSGMTIRTTAKEVIEKSISDSEFEIPKGYKIKKEKL